MGTAAQGTESMRAWEASSEDAPMAEVSKVVPRPPASGDSPGRKNMGEPVSVSCPVHPGCADGSDAAASPCMVMARTPATRS